MIRINRGPEPRQLTRARGNNLTKAISAFHAHGAPSIALTATLQAGFRNPTTKTALFSAQHKKCAWCERRRDLSSSPVEHYRPKDGAWRHKRGEEEAIEPTHYWWLTWTWSNLLFACARCNDRGHKANYFPVMPGTAAAVAPSAPLSLPVTPTTFPPLTTEHPALLDPADPTDDPLDHIRWEPSETLLARRLWKWQPRGLTPRGTATISILKLDELVDEVEDHLLTIVLPSVEEVDQHLAEGRTPQAHGRWSTLLNDTLAPQSPLSAATWCALERWMPPAQRVTHGLAHPKRP